MPETAAPRVTKKSLQAKVTSARRALHVAEQTEADFKVIARLAKALEKAQSAVDDWQPAAPKTVELAEPIYSPSEIAVMDEQANIQNGTEPQPTTVEPDATPIQEDSMTDTQTELDVANDEDFYDADAQEISAPKGVILGDEPPAPMKRKSGERKASGPRKGKHDEAVDYLFDNPGVSARLANPKTGEPLTFTNSSVKQTMQKKYADWTDDDGNKLIVTVVRIAEKTYGAWLKVGQPEVSQPTTVQGEFGAESVVPSDDGEV